MVREFAPSARLAPWVEAFWTRDAFSSDTAVTQRVLPDGCADVVFADGAAIAIGTMTSPLVLTETRAPALLGVRFRPGRAPLGVPLAEITDARVPLADLWPGDSLGERVAEASTTARRIDIIEDALLARAGEAIDEQIDYAVDCLARGASVEQVARELGVTRQHLRRRFLDRVGVGPKTFARVARFRRVLDAARRGRRPEWAGIAADLGYADQSHLIAEFREFAGSTPVPFLLSA
jgi:AraC-like DNA-binding protein